MSAVDRLTTLDTSFLWLERPDAPIHVGAVAVFEARPLLDDRGELRLDDLRARVLARLDRLPRLRRRLAPVPLDLDRPAWVDDPDFDVADHVRAVRLPPPGDDEQFRRLAERLHSESLPRDRPLWDLHVVTGLAGDRVGLVERVHHALVDGVGGVELATLLLDLTPDAPAPSPPPTPWRPAAPPDGLALAAAGAVGAVTAPLRVARTVARAAVRPDRAVRTALTTVRGLASLAADGLLAPRTSINAPIRGRRHLEWLRVPFGGVRSAARRAGGTVNDVVLAAVAGGLRALLAHRGEPLPGDRVVKVLVPVSRRKDGSAGSLGNEVSAIDAPLPVGIGDPDERLRTVVATMRRLKSAPQAEALETLLRGTDALPAPLARAIARAVERQPFVNMVVTNVPGPPFPLYVAGARMLEAYPVVPLGANLTIGVAVLSYDGALSLTTTADTEACPDAHMFVDGTRRALAQLTG